MTKIVVDYTITASMEEVQDIIAALTAAASALRLTGDPDAEEKADRYDVIATSLTGY